MRLAVWRKSLSPATIAEYGEASQYQPSPARARARPFDMSAVQILAVGPEDSELRLDRWFKRHFPGLGHGRLEKLLRTGQVRIDGRRASAGARLSTGQSIRVPPLDAAVNAPARPSRSFAPPRDSDLAAIRAAVLYRDA